MSKGKILVIDDEEAVLTVAKRTLEAAGFTVVTLDSPLKMPAVVHREHPDLILLDIEMPALRGDKVMEFAQLFDFLRRCPIVLHSSKSEHELQEMVTKTGASGYIKKTGNAISFVNQVEQWIGKPHST